jgi:hypothetical protein
MPPQSLPARPPQRIAVLGAESTGKTQLAGDLAAALQESGRSTALVPEVLREWCDREGRTPRPDEQAAIAQEQARRVLALDAVDFVIADTTPLMTALYSHIHRVEAVLRAAEVAAHLDLAALGDDGLHLVVAQAAQHARHPLGRAGAGKARAVLAGWAEARRSSSQNRRRSMVSTSSVSSSSRFSVDARWRCGCSPRCGRSGLRRALTLPARLCSPLTGRRWISRPAATWSSAASTSGCRAARTAACSAPAPRQLLQRLMRRSPCSGTTPW